MNDEDKRRLIVAAAMEWSVGAHLAPGFYEDFMLQLFIRGKLSMEECVFLLEEYEAQRQALTESPPPKVYYSF